jgi:peptidoglycan/LPS O-acetylase OafA/YrhL
MRSKDNSLDVPAGVQRPADTGSAGEFALDAEPVECGGDPTVAIEAAPDHSPVRASRGIRHVPAPASVLPESQRNHALDGLRGIAALSVAVGHCFMIIGGVTMWESSIRNFPGMNGTDIALRLVSLLVPAESAVMVFFVLSGYVLWTSYQRKDFRFVADLPDYVCSRTYRLFPVAIMSALPLGLLIDASARELVLNMLLVHRSLNGVLWTLQVEVAASLQLFAIWCLTRGVGWKVAVALVLSISAVPFFRGNPYVVFVPAFIFGASITLVPVSVWRRSWIIGPAIVALVVTNLLFGFGGVSRCFEILGATALVGAVVAGRFGFLRARVSHFFGAISYPFYLTHPIGLFLAGPVVQSLPLASPFVKVFALAASSIAVAVPIAWVLHVFVEDPVLRARPRIRVALPPSRSGSRPGFMRTAASAILRN